MIHRSVIVTACLTVLGLAVGAGAVAGDFNLVWDASPGATGYKLHYGTQPNQYTSTDDVGNVTQTTLSGLDDCSKWYFAVSAYNSSGESGYSNVVDSFLVREVSKLLGTQRTSAVARQGETFDLSLTGSAFDAGVGMTLIHPDWMCPRPDCLPSERSQSHLDGLTPEVRDTLRIENVQSVSCTEVQARVVTGPGTPGGRAAEEGGYNLTLTRGDGDVFEVNGAVAVLRSLGGFRRQRQDRIGRPVVPGPGLRSLLGSGEPVVVVERVPGGLPAHRRRAGLNCGPARRRRSK